MNKLQRDLISRATAGLVGLALLWVAWKVLGVAHATAAEAAEQARRASGNGSRRGGGGAIHLYLFMGFIAFVGVLFVLYAAVPRTLAERLFRPSPPRTGEVDDPNDSWWMWLMRWW